MKASQMRPSRRSAAWVAAAFLVAFLLVAQSAWACLPVRAQGIDGSPHRFEGFIKAKSLDTWVVGSDLEGYKLVFVSSQTPVINKGGLRAEVGAWVVVFAIYTQSQWQAYLIQVERPAGAPGVPVQFTGKVTKMGANWWKVDDAPVEVPPTAIITGSPRIGSLVWVGAVMLESGLRAEWIRVFPTRPVVEFEGILHEIGSDYWVINDRRVMVPDDVKISGVLLDALVECQALVSEDNTLVAIQLHVVSSAQQTKKTGTIIEIQPEPDGAATWRVLVDQLDPDAKLLVEKVRVADNTWVDETRAVARNGQWIRMRGMLTNDNGYQADFVRVEHGAQSGAAAGIKGINPAGSGAAPWSVPAPIASNLDNVDHPMLAFTGDGAAHAIWETDNWLYHAQRGANGIWSAPEPVAYGFAPYMIAEGNSTLHVAFVNSFMGNYETYYVVWRAGKWSLPVNMSHTDGYSAQPKLALAPDGVLNAVWMDNTPGYWTTYHATWKEPFWSSRPIPSGRGEAPSLTVAQNGVIYAVWQDRVSRDGMELGDFDVFLATLQNDIWTPPLNLSESPGVNTLGPDVIATADGMAHAVWIEGEERVRYSFGQSGAWSMPTTVATSTGYANGARIVAEADKTLHIAWDEEYAVSATSAPGGTLNWPASRIVVEDSNFLSDVSLTRDPSGGVGLVWSQTSPSGRANILASHRESLRIYRFWLPLIF